MINVRAAVIRILTCAIGGAVFGILLLNFVPLAPMTHTYAMLHKFGIAYSGNHPWESDALLHVMGSPVPTLLVFAGIGAFIGLLPGIAWAIDEEPARRRFLLWSSSGIVIGVILAVATGRVLLMFAITLAGVYVGGVTALKRLGAYKTEEDNQATGEDE